MPPSASANERGRGRDNDSNNASSGTGQQQQQQQRTIGLPRVPSPFRRGQDPTLSQYLRIGTNPWSSLHSNPTARHYQAVANRRVASTSTGGSGSNVNSSSNAEAVRTVRDTMARMNEEEEQRAAARPRPLEDPHLVGEEAAARARRARLARENGDDILIREDRRWDWFLGKSIPPIAFSISFCSSPLERCCRCCCLGVCPCPPVFYSSAQKYFERAKHLPPPSMLY